MKIPKLTQKAFNEWLRVLFEECVREFSQEELEELKKKHEEKRQIPPETIGGEAN